MEGSSGLLRASSQMARKIELMNDILLQLWNESVWIWPGCTSMNFVFVRIYDWPEVRDLVEDIRIGYLTTRVGEIEIGKLILFIRVQLPR